ncbi:MAG: sodium-translocating pyrophosphatase [Elusimicrobia bacterium]|nr:sodium-translocating pyrophosphatase [Elusimicrobiota bacterium]
MSFSFWISGFVALGIVGFLLSVWVYRQVSLLPDGNEKMQEIAAAIRAGAMAFLWREYSIILGFILLVFALLTRYLGFFTGLAFVTGGLCSLAAGVLGMRAATAANVRTTQAAKNGGMGEALFVAFRGGSVMGLAVASLGLLGLALWYLAVAGDPAILSGFAMGASSIALFARVGGGIYTKCADVGADLVGKVEAGIPEDDPRNPAVIADNVGDCVGDTAGMGADLFESYVGAVVAAVALGFSLPNPQVWMTYPLAVVAVGLLASGVGIFFVRSSTVLDPQKALRYATGVSGLSFLIAAYFMTRYWTGQSSAYLAVVSGFLAGLLIGLESEFYTSGRPVLSIARSSETGPATTVITGMALGMESVILPMLTICAAIYAAFSLAGLYGIALAAVGMLSIIGMVMSVDSYGPIADNAGGIAQMSGAGPEVRRITDRLDSLGNTTAAIGKGFAIGSAALTALALFSAYTMAAAIPGIDLVNPRVVIGLFLGGLIPFFVAAHTMKAVGRAAFRMVHEVRRQFRDIPGLMEGTAAADYTTCVDIATRGALKEMILPGAAAVSLPVLVGFFMGAEALGGLLAGATVCGVLLGIMMSNAGGAWDNAKKYIEAGNLGGKGSAAHKAAVVGDTIGDPLKDTSGPSMNILIKLMSIVSLVIAPLLVR